MKKQKFDMTPICDKCHKIAPINRDKSNWIVYEIKEPCECGGRYRPRYFVENEQEV